MGACYPRRVAQQAQQGPLLRPGFVLSGRYEIRRSLGMGGMGAVFEAWHLRLGRPAAIKVLLPEYANNAEFHQRFEQEARLAAKLRSPHVVRVMDVDTSPEGLTYLVMELLDGQDLGREADLRDIPYPELVDWIMQVCAGLAEAHAQGIIHRDIKPGNIFLASTPDGTRVAKLLDFGISKSFNETAAPITRPADGVLGTPNFMAPEQIRGWAARPETDLWALGVILYRLFSRAWPFHGSSDAGYLASALADPAVPLSAHRPDLPVGLADVVMRALAKRPEERFATATEMATALAPFGTGRVPVSSRAPAHAPSDPQIWRSLPPPAASDRARVSIDGSAHDATTVASLDTSARGGVALSAPQNTGGGVRALVLGLITLGLLATLGVVAYMKVGARARATPTVAAAPDTTTSSGLPAPSQAAPVTAANDGTPAPRPPPTGVQPDETPEPASSSSASARGRPPRKGAGPASSAASAPGAATAAPTASELPPFL